MYNAAMLTFLNGGGTFTLRGVSVVKDSGYMVGGLVPTSIVAETTPEDLCKDLSRFVNQHYRMLGKWGAYVGTWVHEGNVYIDGSQWVATLDDALALGKARGELAIWDCAKGEAVPCQ